MAPSGRILEPTTLTSVYRAQRFSLAAASRLESTTAEGRGDDGRSNDDTCSGSALGHRWGTDARVLVPCPDLIRTRRPDGDPLRLMLLGEGADRLFGTPPGGWASHEDHRCPHRCASLFLARNEDNGIRCVYHGWKFDVTGACVEMPNVPPSEDYKHEGSRECVSNDRTQRSDLDLHGEARSSTGPTTDRGDLVAQ